MKASEARKIMNEQKKWPLCVIYSAIESAAKAGMSHLEYSLDGVPRHIIESLNESLLGDGYRTEHRSGTNLDGDFWEVLAISW